MVSTAPTWPFPDPLSIASTLVEAFDTVKCASGKRSVASFPGVSFGAFPSLLHRPIMLSFQQIRTYRLSFRRFAEEWCERFIFVHLWPRACYLARLNVIRTHTMMPDGTYDTMQACLNGHCINSSYGNYPSNNKAFCSDCGEPTITACPVCRAHIKGFYHLDGFPLAAEAPVPAFCDACGMAYPWQVTKVANTLELLRLEGVAEADVQEIERNLPNITRDTPGSQVAARRVRQMLSKAGKPIYDISIKIIADVASASAKSHLGL